MFSQDFDKDRIFEEAGVHLPSDTPLLSVDQTQAFIEEEQKSEGWGDNPSARAIVLAGLVGTGLGILLLFLGFGKGGGEPKVVEDETDTTQQELFARIQKLEQQNSELRAKQALSEPSKESSDLPDIPPHGEEAETVEDTSGDEPPDASTLAREPIADPGPRPVTPPPPPIVFEDHSRRASRPVVQKVPEVAQAADPIVVPPPVVEPIAELPPQFSASSEPISPSVPAPKEPQEKLASTPVITEDTASVVVAADFNPPVTKQVLTGTAARIQLDRDLSWKEGQSRERRVLAHLLEPLLFGDGTPWLEQGTALVLSDRGVTSFGEVQLELIAYQHGGREHPVDSGAFVVQALDGGVVVAHKQGGRTVGDDIQDILVDAAVEEAQELIEGSVGGIGGEILNAALARNKAIIEPSGERPTRYFLERETELSLVANKAVEVSDEPDIVQTVEISAPPSPEVRTTELHHASVVEIPAAAPKFGVVEPTKTTGREQKPRTLAELQAGVLEREQELPTLEHLLQTMPDRDRGSQPVVIEKQSNEILSPITPRVSDDTIRFSPTHPCDRTTIPITF